MERNISEEQRNMEKIEQKERGERIKSIREQELKMNKTQLGEAIGISGQFLGLVEEGRGNLTYRSVKKLRDLSGHSSDYILYGLDDNMIEETKSYLENYTEQEIMQAIEIIKNITLFIKKS